MGVFSYKYTCIQEDQAAMSFEQYVMEELEYYDQHPEEDDQITECHSNSFVAFDLDYTTQS